jgi:predicted GNAT family acetyltransferase
VSAFEFSHEVSGTKGAFVALAAGTRAGEMTYSRMNAHAVIVDHTGVFEGFEGTGLGKQLVAYGVAWAREHQQRIMPLCPFARALFERTPAYQDVWFR